MPTAPRRSREIKHQAELVKLNLKAAGVKPDADGGLPTTIVLRADRDTPFSMLLQPDHRLPGQRLPQVRAQGDERDLRRIGRSHFHWLHTIRG